MSRRISLNELWKISSRTITPDLCGLLGWPRSFDVEDFQWWPEYIENMESLDYMQKMKRGYLLYIEDVDDSDIIAIRDFHAGVKAFLKTNKESFDRIYSALKEEYEILDNYNGTEVETVNTSGSGTSNTGAQRSSNTTGAQTSTSTASTSPWNEGSNFTDKEKTSEQNGERTDSAEVGAREDSSSFSNEETRTLTRHGNLGITTSQMMIESELRLRMQNAFFEILWSKMAAELFIFCDEGYDPF